MELDDKLHNIIINMCKKVDELYDSGIIKEALLEYQKALDLLPNPKRNWEAYSWIELGIGEVI